MCSACGGDLRAGVGRRLVGCGGGGRGIERSSGAKGLGVSRTAVSET